MAMMGFDGWGMGFAGWIFMMVFWVALIALIVWGLTRLLPRSGSRGADRPKETPEEILDRRFASGDIDAETYRNARNELAAHRAEPR
jgi:putative membrane protein